MCLVTAGIGPPHELFPTSAALALRSFLLDRILQPLLYHHKQAELLKRVRPKLFD